MTPAPATDYGELVTRLRGMRHTVPWYGHVWVHPKALNAAADAIEALQAIVSAREDMDVQHAEVIDQQQEHISALEAQVERLTGLLARCRGPVASSVTYWALQEREACAPENRLLSRRQAEEDRQLATDIDAALSSATREGEK